MLDAMNITGSLVIDSSSTSEISDARVTQAIFALLSSRAPNATVCPSK